MRIEVADEREYPHWTPKGLLPDYLDRTIDTFRSEHFEGEPFEDFVYKLATDLRMKPVWANLLNRAENHANALPIPARWKRIRIDSFPLNIAELLYRSLFKPSSVDEVAQISARKRRQLLQRIRSNAEQLSLAMQELKLPMDVSCYVDDGHAAGLSTYLADFLLENFWFGDETPEFPEGAVDAKSHWKFLEEHPRREMPEWAPESAEQISRTTLDLGDWPRLDLQSILKNLSDIDVLETLLPPVYLKKDGLDNPRTYAIRILAELFVRDFGSPLYESVATIMSVALGDENFSRDNVRSALKGFDFPRSN